MKLYAVDGTSIDTKDLTKDEYAEILKLGKNDGIGIKFESFIKICGEDKTTDKTRNNY
jgi:hypothetical protein